MRKGFTLIELMIVVAIIAIIAAIAIPNLMASRIQANESNAIAACKQYGAAQNIYMKSNYGALTQNYGQRQYADTIPALREHTNAGGEAIDLISQQFADAGDAAAGTEIPYQGYRFESSNDITTRAAWKYEYAMFAFPSLYNRTGVNSFWIDTKGVVLMKDQGDNSVQVTMTGATPDPDWVVP